VAGAGNIVPLIEPRYSPRFWGMTSVLRATLRTTLFSIFDQNLAENLANLAHSTFQQIQTER
jgi:hypothetical protein